MPRRRLQLSLTLAAALTLGGGLATTAVLTLAVKRLEIDNQTLAFEQGANVRVAALRQGMDEAIEVLNVTNQLFTTVQPVTRSQFHDFTIPLLLRNPYIKAFNFHRAVQDADRAAFEAELQRIRPGTVLREMVDGRLVQAPRRPHYNVVDYLEPIQGNEPAFGLNVGENGEVARALARAHASGRASATGLLRLAQAPDGQPSFEVVMPVYGPAGRLLGDTAAVIEIQTLARSTLARAGLLEDRSILLKLYLGPQSAAGAMVYANHEPGEAGAPELPPLSWLARPAARMLDRFVAAGQTWTVEAAAAPRPYLADHLASTLLAAGGLLSTLLLAAFVQAAGQRARKVQELVRERTADLKLSNQRLIDDVLARKRTEKALQESEQRFRQLVAMSSDWYWEQDAQLRFVALTGHFTEKSGIAVERILGRTRAELVGSLADSDAGREHLAAIEAREPFRNMEYRSLDDNGEERWYCVSGQPIFDDAGRFTGYRGTGSDITARKITEQRVHHVAQHDVLTGLPNRSLLQDRLGQAVAYANRSGHPVWVMLIDLDRFKFVNDSMGHKAGDVLLMTVAARLRSSLRDTDTVARLSGDEFVVILSQHEDQPLSADIVQRVMDSVAQPVMLGPKEFFVTCSIGVAAYPSDGTPAESLIEHADIAMYRAKKLGRNNFQFYTPAMNEESLERVRIESALRNALERNEFVLHYQPQVDLKSGQIVGMEALIRWKHPELGMVPPSRFVGVAEDTGLIVPIGAWVMRTACAQNKAWQDAGLGQLRVAVNLSARQFSATELLPGIEQVLLDTGLDPSCLELELTESLFMSDVTPAVDLLHRMKSLGVKLSIDDFGTGYSSFSYLSRFPIDVLKIDRSFVNDITHDANDAAIVASIIALAHNLRLSVIAEGVETAEQLDYLRHQGCDEMQGYYFSRPLPAQEFEQLLRQRRGLAAFEDEPQVAVA
ncbi:diguanylate cyclase [Massilia sp. WF1]|uniref:bifunctional diguanylate cyclase/phosphodiesterase n=1 Tax=unclassified Massilia TaxID=2609279 RepID=UPI0006493ACF|nr:MULTISPECIES: EAL domain-containing protein [unclassified Massilia]ALK96640.1 diguanylate cyclase [Massilia sp. WG5]KLU35366.1 diguanylate cyclase [Massilia sp. WF1]